VASILVIEDDKDLRRGIVYCLEKNGFTVHFADTLDEGKKIFCLHTIDIIILDLNLPDGDGINFCKDLRKESNVPILMLTVRDLETDELAGLEAGADDYITKPFSVSILRARVERLLRRFDSIDKRQDTNIVISGAYMLNLNSFKFYQNDIEIPISATEFRMLNLFMNNTNAILSKEQISSVLWENHENFVDDNALSVNISRLRSKIETNPKKPTIIKTIHGVGYCWVDV